MAVGRGVPTSGASRPSRRDGISRRGDRFITIRRINRLARLYWPYAAVIYLVLSFFDGSSGISRLSASAHWTAGSFEASVEAGKFGDRAH